MTVRRDSRSNLSEKEIRALAAVIKGRVLTPGNPDYEKRRRVWNGMIDRRPGIIVQPASTDDIVATVNTARGFGTLLAIRGGGHSAAGHGTCDGGILLDLSSMKQISVDPDKRIASAQGGALWGELDEKTHAHGLATVGGTVSDTGIGGLTLGGGLGWLMGRHGLTCDNLISADVVNASGKRVVASEYENVDLFWALRGGGGNFGVVTEFRYRLHEVTNVLGGLLIHPIDRAREMLKFYREAAAGMPDELMVFPGLMTAPDGTPVAALIVGYMGDPARGEKHIAPLRKFGPPVADTIAPLPYVQHQKSLEASVPYGISRYWKSTYVKKLSDGFIDALLANVLPLPSPMCAVLLFHLHGAATRVQPTETAYSLRAEQWDLDIIAQWTDPADSSRLIPWVRNAFDAVMPHASSGVYLNHLGDDDGDRVESALGVSHWRLAQIKLKYDPENLFRVNHNIKPATPDQG